MVALRGQGNWRWEGTLGTPLGLVHWKRASYNNGLLALSYLKPEYNVVTNNKELSITAINRIKNTSPDYKKTYYTTDGTVTLHVKDDSTIEFKQ